MRASSLVPCLVLCLALAAAGSATDITTFRGPDRDGIFPGESILQSWPDGGPPLLWSQDGLGETYASMTIAGGRLYTTGMADLRGTVFAFSLDGERLWSTEYGAESDGRGYPGTRTTPTVANGRLFLLSSTGQAVALDAKTGEILWRVDILERFGGPNLRFGISESPLVVDDKVIYTPGGSQASLVALDQATGNVVWRSRSLGDASAYCNPRLLTRGDERQIVTLLASKLIGVDPDSGEILWTADHPGQYDIHAVSPLFHEDLIIVSDGYKQGTVAFRLAADGRSATRVWKNDRLDIHHGGGVIVDGRLYGASSSQHWFALDASTGKELAQIRRLGKGSVIYADGRLIGYVESGDVVLVDPDPAQFAAVSTFEITLGVGQHWSHPIIADGVLYVRHGGVLMAYDIRVPTAPAESTGR
ncbi:MAG: PQQ-binding-like beta-propeller repeat protein [Acidobacteriota bacterium]